MFSQTIRPFSIQMVQFNCSSSDFLHHNSTSAWCQDANEKNCRAWNFSAEELQDLCLSRSKYLEKYLGPRQSPLFLPVCATYLFIFMAGVLGNVLTCTVIGHYKIMQTPTNYYLFSLAVSDLLVLLLGMPLELYEMWNNYPFLLGPGGCHFKTFLFETVCFASVLNVTALSAERYLAVVHPLKVKRIATKTHVKCVILALWVLSIICAVPNTSLHGLKYLPPRFGQHFPESATCEVVKPTWIYNLLVLVTALVFFLLPMMIIGVLYLLIGLHLYRERMFIEQVTEVNLELNQGVNGHKSTQQNRRHRQVTKMLSKFSLSWIFMSASRKYLN